MTPRRGKTVESDGNPERDAFDSGDAPATTALLGVLLAVYIGQQLLSGRFGGGSYAPLAVRSDRLWLVPTWFTATLIHGPPVHLLLNGSFLYFFGRGVERTYGSRVLVGVFVTTGAMTAVFGTVLAGLNDCGIAAFQSIEGCHIVGGGSSMGLAGLVGYVTLRRPTVPFSFLPSSRLSVPLWTFTAAFLAVSILGMYTSIDPIRGLLGFPPGHAYHFVGILAGGALGIVWTPYSQAT
ncbi:rhomboid family intramembrane serine protease [Halosimplex sp. J119]